MIQLPERAVTRFFVPLIDVLILLFCIFLLLPFVSAPADTKSAADAPVELEALRERLKKTEDALDKERDRAKNPTAAAQETTVWLIDINEKTGAMTHAALDGPPGARSPIASPADASNFILRTKAQTNRRQVKYVFVCPRTPSGYPDKATLANIAKWFAGEAVTIDNPFAPR